MDRGKVPELPASGTALWSLLYLDMLPWSHAVGLSFQNVWSLILWLGASELGSLVWLPLDTWLPRATTQFLPPLSPPQKRAVLAGGQVWQGQQWERGRNQLKTSPFQAPTDLRTLEGSYNRISFSREHLTCHKGRVSDSCAKNRVV